MTQFLVSVLTLCGLYFCSAYSVSSKSLYPVDKKGCCGTLKKFTFPRCLLKFCYNLPVWRYYPTRLENRGLCIRKNSMYFSVSYYRKPNPLPGRCMCKKEALGCFSLPTTEAATAKPTAVPEPETASPESTIAEPTASFKPETTSPEPTTTEPTSPEPTTTELTSPEPTTTESISPEPMTTEPTTSPEPMTTEPITSPESTTEKPTSPELTTTEPTTSSEPTTVEPTTSPEPTTAEPTTSPEPTTAEPTTSPELTTAEPTSPEPTTAEPITSPEPTMTEPISPEPTTTQPTTSPEPTTTEPITSLEPSSTEPTTSSEPTTSPEPMTTEPTSPEPTTTEPTTSPEPVTTEPITSPEPATTEPITSPEPTTAEPTTSLEPETTEPTASLEPVTSVSTASLEPETIELTASLGPETEESTAATTTVTMLTTTTTQPVTTTSPPVCPLPPTDVLGRILEGTAIDKCNISAVLSFWVDYRQTCNGVLGYNATSHTQSVYLTEFCVMYMQYITVTEDVPAFGLYKKVNFPVKPATDFTVYPNHLATMAPPGMLSQSECKPTPACLYDPDTMSDLIDFSSCYIASYGSNIIVKGISISTGPLNKVEVAKHTSCTTKPATGEGAIDCFIAVKPYMRNCWGDNGAPVFCHLTSSDEEVLYGLVDVIQPENKTENSMGMCATSEFHVLPISKKVKLRLPSKLTD